MQVNQQVQNLFNELKFYKDFLDKKIEETCILEDISNKAFNIYSKLGSFLNTTSICNINYPNAFKHSIQNEKYYETSKMEKKDHSFNLKSQLLSDECKQEQYEVYENSFNMSYISDINNNCLRDENLLINSNKIKKNDKYVINNSTSNNANSIVTTNHIDISNDNDVFTNNNVDKNIFQVACKIFNNKANIGEYSWQTRIKKILSYKLNVIRYKINKPAELKYARKSKIANKKLRYKGRFIKSQIKDKKVYFKVIKL